MPPGRIRHDVASTVDTAGGRDQGGRTDDDVRRELPDIALAEDELRRQGHAPHETARLARAAAGGRIQALLKRCANSAGLARGSARRGSMSGWGFVCSSEAGGLTPVGGFLRCRSRFRHCRRRVRRVRRDCVEPASARRRRPDCRHPGVGLRGRAGGEARPWQDVERWRASLQSVEDVGAFQTIERNAIAQLTDRSKSAPVAEISGRRVSGLRGCCCSSAGDRLCRSWRPAPPPSSSSATTSGSGASPARGTSSDASCVWPTPSTPSSASCRTASSSRSTSVIRASLQRDNDTLRNTGPEGVVFGRLAPDATLARAHAEVSALGSTLQPAVRSAQREGGVDWARGAVHVCVHRVGLSSSCVGPIWVAVQPRTVSPLLPPCANIAIRNYAAPSRGSRSSPPATPSAAAARGLSGQLFVELLAPTTAAAGVSCCDLRVVSVVVAWRLQQIPGGAAVLDDLLRVGHRTLLLRRRTGGRGSRRHVWASCRRSRRRGAWRWSAAPGLAGLQETLRRAGRHVDHAGRRAGRVLRGRAAAGRRTSCPGTVRTTAVGPGFAAEEFATARVAVAGIQRRGLWQSPA